MPKHQETTRIIKSIIISGEEANKTPKHEPKGFMSNKFYRNGFAQRYQREKY